MSKHKREYDKHLIDALEKLSWPIIEKSGKKVLIRSNARNESGMEHIASKRHFLKVRDIEIIPSILKKPICIKRDERKGIAYYGKRKGDNKELYLKVVTKEDKIGNLIIITICPTKKLP